VVPRKAAHEGAGRDAQDSTYRAVGGSLMMLLERIEDVIQRWHESTRLDDLTRQRRGESSQPVPPNALKLRRGWQRAQLLAAGESAAPAPQPCGGRMPGQLSPAALWLGRHGVGKQTSCNIQRVPEAVRSRFEAGPLEMEIPAKCPAEPSNRIRRDHS